MCKLLKLTRPSLCRQTIGVCKLLKLSQPSLCCSEEQSFFFLFHKHEEDILKRVTPNNAVYVYFTANPVTRSKGQRSPKQCTLVVLMGGYNHTKRFGEIQYHIVLETQRTGFHQIPLYVNYLP